MYIQELAQPCKADPCPTYGPGDIAAKYILELNAGQVDKQGILVGDDMELLEFR